ncbi:MAG: LysR family transcriptional regulator [Chromatiales bacterium]|nr:LysR family transcriptional regulator [Chromatiales bacterium]
MNTLVQMATFATVVERGSFTAAAEALGLSKPVVSKQISQLETHLGVRLLNRTTRRLHLTEAGEVFYTHCQRIVAEAQEAETAVAPLQSEPSGLLRITTPQCLALSHLNRLLPRFQQQFPKLTLEVSVSGHFVDLVEEGIDVALRIGELEDSSLIARHLTTCSFMVCASPEYWKRHGKPKHPSELATHNCLTYTQSQKPNHWFFQEKTGEELKVTVNGDFRSDDAALLIDTARAGQGVLFGPSFMYEEGITEGWLEPVLNSYFKRPTGLYSIYPHSKHLSSKVRVFVDFLADELDKNPLEQQIKNIG